MRIAVFNENRESGNNLKNLIYRFSNYYKLELVVDVFSDYTLFLKSPQNYILTFISLTTENGIRVVKTLYNRDETKNIIITSDNYRHAADAFKINAYNFLKTPVEEKPLFKILNDYFDSFFSKPLLLIGGIDNTLINADDIMYIEADNKYCWLHLKDDTLQCKKTMAHVLDTLPENHFIKISRFFAVNPDYVTNFNSDVITLKGDIKLHPSRLFYKEFKCDFMRLKCPIII